MQRRWSKEKGENVSIKFVMEDSEEAGTAWKPREKQRERGEDLESERKKIGHHLILKTAKQAQ